MTQSSTDQAAPRIRYFTGTYGPCIELSSAQGLAIVALEGGQLISWVPAGGEEVFWRTARPARAPAPLRGGVPICWPWFARQGVPEIYPQHGVVRTLSWTCLSQTIGPEGPSVTLAPDWAQCSPVARKQLEQALGVSVNHITLTQTIALQGQRLNQELVTYNGSDKPLRLTQALHTYFAVGDAREVQIDGLQNKHFLDKLQGFSRIQQVAPFVFDSACDRIYLETQGRFILTDPVKLRAITLLTEQSESLVVWNPGATEGAKMADVGPDQWPYFFCLEASQAEPHGVTLVPHAHGRLAQTLECRSLTGAPWRHSIQ